MYSWSALLIKSYGFQNVDATRSDELHFFHTVWCVMYPWFSSFAFDQDWKTTSLIILCLLYMIWVEGFLHHLSALWLSLLLMKFCIWMNLKSLLGGQLLTSRWSDIKQHFLTLTLKITLSIKLFVMHSFVLVWPTQALVCGKEKDATETLTSWLSPHAISWTIALHTNWPLLRESLQEERWEMNWWPYF